MGYLAASPMWKSIIRKGNATVDSVCELSKKLVANVEKVILGKHDVVELVLVSILCEGHLLIEDVPGVGKTMLAKAISKSLGCSYARIQCTPDLLPSDILGVNVYNQKTGEFEFRPGPVHNQVILVDEINRATPKTQSALLECMEERQITIDGITRILPKPFMVIATQNPIEYEGTFPLPESQLDRFFMRLHLGYPSFSAENDILIGQQISHPIESLEAVITPDELLNMQARIREVHIDPSLREYIVRIVQETRNTSSIILGASPRGSLALFRASQALAAINSRDYIIPDDIKRIAEETLSHRVISRNEMRESSNGRRNKLEEILNKVPVPI